MDIYTFEFFRVKLENMERKLDALLKQGEQTMAQIDDLNSAIQAEDVEINDILPVVTKIGADIAALEAAVAAGAKPTDLTAQIQAVQSHVASLTTALQQLQAADASTTTLPAA